MLKIAFGNSFSKIEGLNAVQEKALKKELSYVENADSAWYGNGFLRRKSLLGKKGEFPTGLFPRVQKFLHTGDLFPYEYQHGSPPKRTRIKSDLTVTPWADQINAVNAAIVNHRGIISMPTGTGKSLVAAMLCQATGVKTLIVVPNLEIKRQLMEDISRYLTNSSFITIENIDSKALNTLTDFDMLIIDEAHHVAAKTYHKLNRKAWKGIYYRFFLTATPFRNQTDETLLFEAIAGSVIFQLDYITAVKRGYIVPVEAYYIEIPKKATEGYSYREVYNDLVVNNVEAHKIIADLLSRLDDSKSSTLCLVKEVNHGNRLANSFGFNFVHGSSDDRAIISDFNNSKCKILIGTTGILGEGVDTKPCEFVIVAGMGKAKSAFMQAVGRSTRKFPGKVSAKVILIKYQGHKFCSRHYQAQKRILLEEYGVTPIKIDL